MGGQRNARKKNDKIRFLNICLGEVNVQKGEIKCKKLKKMCSLWKWHEVKYMHPHTLSAYMLINLESVLTMSTKRAEVAGNKCAFMYGSGKRRDER